MAGESWTLEQAPGWAPGAPDADGQRRFAVLQEAGAPMFIIETVGDLDHGATSYTAPLRRGAVRSLQASRLRGHVGVVASAEPTPDERDASAAFWRVVLDDGNVYFLHGASEDVFAGGDGIVRRIENPYVAPEPPESRGLLFPGSDVLVLSSLERGEMSLTPLSNGAEIRTEELETYRAIADDLHDPTPELLDDLSRLLIQSDFVSGRVTIHSPNRQSHWSGWEPPFELYIVKSSSQYELRVRVQLEANHWAFARRFTIAADDYRWAAEPMSDWSRYQYGGGINEVIDRPMTPKLREAATNLARAERGVVRFYGRSQTLDRELGTEERRDIRVMMELYEALKR